MSHELYLTVMDHLTDHHITTNYTPDMRIYYPEYWDKELEPCTSAVV